MLTKRQVKRITLKSHGHSTLGGRKVWFDNDVRRLNYDGHGKYLGEFNDDDSVLVMLDGGSYHLTDFDLNNHFEDNITLIEKMTPTRFGQPFSSMPTTMATSISSVSSSTRER